MINVLVSGAKGRMGTCVVEAVAAAEDLAVVGCYDPHFAGEAIACSDGSFICSDDLAALIQTVKPDVMVDFSHASCLKDNVRVALSMGVSVVTGTTGVPASELEAVALEAATDGARLFFAPNFTTGAVLMMQFARMAARFFPDVEIIEMHHNGKKDAPSGTAITTAHMVGAARDGAVNAGPDARVEIDGCAGARGCEVDGVRIHSIRGDGYMASQEVIMSAAGQTLTIRHDSTLRTSYMPGVLLAVRAVQGLDQTFTMGLEKLMGM